MIERAVQSQYYKRQENDVEVGFQQIKIFYNYFLFIQTRMCCLSLKSITLLLVFMTVFVQNSENATQIQLRQTVQTIIATGEYQLYSFSVPSDFPSGEDIYIAADPLVSDPLQLPSLILTAENYSQPCFNARASFSSFCKVPSKELQKGRLFHFKVSCLSQCHLMIRLYSDKIMTLQLGKEMTIAAFEQTSSVDIINVFIPKNEQYLSLQVTALIENLEETISYAKQGVQMFINWGDQNVINPTESQFMAESQELFSGGRVAFLTREKVPPGLWIKVYLSISKGISVKFSVIKHTGDWAHLSLGKSYFDMLSPNTSQTYQIDTFELKGEVMHRTIELVFNIFSGNPTITLGFDAQFNNRIVFSRNHPSVSVELTPQMRQQYHYSNQLFIKVEATEGTEFQFYTQIVNDEVTLIKPYTAYFDQLNKKQVYNYFLDQRYNIEKTKSSDEIATYNFKVEVSRGQGRFYLARCKAAELSSKDTHNIQNCSLLNSSQLAETLFVERQIEDKTIGTGNLLTIHMKYNMSKCSLLERRNQKQYRQCIFQIVSVGTSDQPWAYSIYTERKYHINFIREREITKEYLIKDSYAFFVFALPDYQNVTEVTFFTTTFSGKSILFVSLLDKFPTIQSNASDLHSQVGPKSSITLKAAQLQQQIYLSVYAEAFTEINIGVTVNRISNNGVKEVYLKGGNILSYTLNKGQSEIHFKTLVKFASNLIVNLNEVVGLVQMQVLKEDGTEVSCGQGGKTRSTCSFKAQKNDSLFVIVVRGAKDKEQQFTISCIHQGRCKSGLLNSPMFVEISGLSGECFTFTLNRPSSLTYTSSLTHQHLAQKAIETQLYFNQQSYNTIDASSFDIEAQNVVRQCPVSKNAGLEFLKSCQVGINFISFTDYPKSFYFSIDQESQQLVLFDGVPKRFPTMQVPQDSRYLYYQVKDNKPIKIFASTASLTTDFYIASKLVTKNSFIKRPSGTNIYPFMSGTRVTDKVDNLFHSILSSTGTSVLTIDSFEIKNIKATQDYCYLLISIFTAPNQQQRQSIARSSALTSQITIEVVQTETILELGSTKNGFVTLGNIETYVVSPQNALVSLRTTDRTGSRGEVCATLQGALANGTVAVKENVVGGGNLQVKKEDGIEYIYVKGRFPHCSYQISYSSLSNPIYNVKLSQPYELGLNKGDTKMYVYYHANLLSFKIVKQVGAGRLSIGLLPIKQKQVLRQAIETNIQKFPIIDNSDAEYVLNVNNEHFCFDCYYLVVLSTNTTFQGEIIFLRISDPVPLTTNYVLQQYLSPQTQHTEEVYYYYSLTDFNLTFQIISGSASVVIQDPTGTTIYSESIKDKRIFTILAKATKQIIDYFSNEARYRVTVSANSEAHYYIQVDKNILTQRIFEGLPANFTISANNPLSVEFINGENLENPLSLMIDSRSNFGRPFPLTFSISGEREDGTPTNNSSLLVNQLESGSTYLLSLQNFRGTYFITIRCEAVSNVTLVLLKQDLTHLSANQAYLFNKQGVYQMFTRQKNVLVEIYNCKGDLYLLASKDIKDTEQLPRNTSSPIVLRRPNYGGHYVLGVEGIFGNYFFRVKTKTNQSELEYKIVYNYYQSIDPYQFIDASNFDINYKWTSSGLRLTINNPKVIEQAEKQLSITNISYLLSISSSKNDLQRHSRCGIQGTVVSKLFINQSQLFVDNQLLQQLPSQLTNQTQEKIYLTVKASVSVQAKEQASDVPLVHEITLFYNTVEVGMKQEYSYIFTNSLIIFLGWILLPVAIAGLLVYYLLRYCIRRLIAKQGNMVEEVEIVAASNPTIPSSSKMIQDGIVHPDSAAAKIKEQL